jgi:nucleoside-diphosphate-sugar epimerase
MMSNILITGASGFIGRRVVSSLSKYHVVKAGVRSIEAAGDLEGIFEIGDILDTTEWADKLIGVNTIIHLAAIAHNKSNDLNYIDKVNVGGTLNLAREAAKLGVKRFIFISSIGVLGNSTTNKRPFDERSNVEAHSEYALSKLNAENALLEIAAETQLEIVIIRPVLVYGLGAPGNFGKLVSLVSNVPILPFGMCRNKRSFISVDNLVDFIKVCITHPNAKNEVFCVSDGVDVSIKEFTNGIAMGLNKKLMQLPIPVSIFRFLSKMMSKNELVEQLIGDLQVDSSKAKQLLEWSPPFTMTETLNKLRVKN